VDPFLSRQQVGGPILLVDDDIFGPLTSTVDGAKCGESTVEQSHDNLEKIWENLFKMVG